MPVFTFTPRRAPTELKNIGHGQLGVRETFVPKNIVLSAFSHQLAFFALELLAFTLSKGSMGLFTLPWNAFQHFTV